MTAGSDPRSGALELAGGGDWSPGLRTVGRLCIDSATPVLLVVAPELRIVYNDAFARLLGKSAPALKQGAPADSALGTLWGVVGEMVLAALAGRPMTAEHVEVSGGNPTLDEITANVSCTPVFASDERTVEGAFCAFTQTPARELEQLRESETGLRAAVDLIGLGRYRSDTRNQAIEWDPRLKAIWGLPASAPVDLGVFVSGIHPEDRERVQAALGASVDPAGDGVCDIEYRVIGVHGGASRWVTTRGKTVFENGAPASFHGVVLDISERKRAEQTNLVLIAELEHRTRNLLAVVSALAEQTLASCESIQDFVEPFRERLATLSRVQGLLSRGEASPVMLGELVELELRALGAEPDGERVSVDGPQVALPNRSVQILALGLHELATNARKHGALGSRDGRLAVKWRIAQENDQHELTLDWFENGIDWSKTPALPSRIGLGRTLIEQSLPFQLDAHTRLDIGPDNVRCVITMTVD
jgi:two-component system, chemotaxis family, CheB/CheR fusion protein